MNLKLTLFIGALLVALAGFSQGSMEYTDGMKVKLNDAGTKYFRIISWAQFWTQYSDLETVNAAGNEESQFDFSIRRARVLMYAQVTDKFLILTHFGLNSQNAQNMSPTGLGANSQLFFHDVWGQWSLTKDHAVGGGLHYWNGISRLNNQSTLNMLTLDNNRQSWASIGLSDQFARHMGVYFKGKFNRFQYRLSINESIENSLDVTLDNAPGVDQAVYRGREFLGGKESGKNFAGYFDYHFLDQESNFLPYKVGSYLGGKKVFNVGAGFFYHPNGSIALDNSGGIRAEDVSVFAVDAFYDAPIGDQGAAITAYATFQSNDYGTNYALGSTYTTGSMFYSHIGYLLPSENANLKFQPYASFNTRSIDAIDDNASRLGIGGNLYLSGHHSKISLEYSRDQVGDLDAINTFTLQAMIYL
ncbi:hypothetical protein BST97_02040 [Nonlabens spongiae]|uniref:Porin n=1 Tax=Nonlabens spongiae TaxID=331648 RepID=A0A1W6MH21_9FLAO|nr:hypothetical protein [Nonlabens spongiae]ARN76877.1 hypothetical protein BST97_02040 [Nonlabens spongiae]